MEKEVEARNQLNQRGINQAGRRGQRDLWDYEALTALNQRIAGWIGAGGGTVSNTNVWGRRQLAYAIGKHTAGIYVQFDFQLFLSASRELERSLRLQGEHPPPFGRAPRRMMMPRQAS